MSEDVSINKATQFLRSIFVHTLIILLEDLSDQCLVCIETNVLLTVAFQHFAQCQGSNAYSVTNMSNNKCPDNDLLAAGGMHTEVESSLYKWVSGEV